MPSDAAMKVWEDAFGAGFVDGQATTDPEAAAAVIERAIAEAVAQERAKAEGLAEALRDIKRNTAAVTADFDNYGMCILSVNTTSTAALKAWEATPPG